MPFQRDRYWFWTITWMSFMILDIIHIVKRLSTSSNDYYFMQQWYWIVIFTIMLVYVLLVITNKAYIRCSVVSKHGKNIYFMIYNHRFNIDMAHHESIFSHVLALKRRKIKRNQSRDRSLLTVTIIVIHNAWEIYIHVIYIYKSQTLQLSN